MLTYAVKGSPYVAIVQHTRTEAPRSEPDGVTYILHARVLKTIRGPKLKEVAYRVVLEHGDTEQWPKEPEILTLCRDDEGFYWPGVGSTFPNEEGARDARAECGRRRA